MSAWPTRRARGGARAQKVGREFERWLKSEHDRAKHEGLIAWMVRIMPEYEIIRVGGEVIPKVIGNGMADFAGQTPAGTSIVVEAKSEAGARFPRSGIEKHQIEHLDDCARGNGIALLALEFRNESPESVWLTQQRYCVPWLEVPWIVLKTAQSVSPAELVGWEMNCTNYLQPFLGAAR